MYQLKKIPKDFIVEEIPQKEFSDNGDYLICKLKKKNYNTEDAVQTICRVLGIARRNLSYAGSKDRNAVTYQYISLYKGSKERIEQLELKDIILEPVGRSKAPLSLGDLKGNKFIITIRNITDDFEPKKLKAFPNYYDSQRFSKNNVKIGRAIIKRDFELAAKTIMNEDYKYGDLIKQVLDKEPNNFIGALQEIPPKILLIYVHAYQSYLWNKQIKEYLDSNQNSEQKDVPLIGFYEPEDDFFKEIIENILQEEEITYRDFIVREIPSLTVEGSCRKLFCDIKDLSISELQTDELNEGMKKVVVKFFLGKGSYATMAIKHIMGKKADHINTEK